MSHLNTLITKTREFDMAVEFSFTPNSAVITIRDPSFDDARIYISQDGVDKFIWQAYWGETYCGEYYPNNVDEYPQFWRIEQLLDVVNMNAALRELNKK